MKDVTSSRTLTTQFQDAVRRRLITAGYKVTSEDWCFLDSRKWGFRLTTGQRIGISVGGAGDPDAIYIVVSGPDAQPVRRLLKPFERPSVQATTRRQHKLKEPSWGGIRMPIGFDPGKGEGYCFHGTRRRSLRSIARKGLVPPEPREGEVVWDDLDRPGWLLGEPEAAYEGPIYAASTYGVAFEYASEYRDGIVLRMPLDPRWDWIGDADIFQIPPIRAESIEVLWEDGNWHPLLAIVATLPTRRRLTTILGIKFVNE